MSFETFIKERQYLQNVSTRTIEWYRESFKWLGTPNPSPSELKEFVIRMRERGLKPSSCNNRIRAVNAYLRWSGSLAHIPKVKEERRVLPTFSLADISKIIRWKAKGKYQQRLYVLMLTLIDTGCRIQEILQLRWEDCDFENLLFTVKGKGSKERRVPFSFELRKLLWKHKRQQGFDHVFCTRHGTMLGRRDVLRDVKRVCLRLGVKTPERTLHAFRHTFALNYLRNGGSVFHLQKALGHSSLEMTRRYVHLSIEDLQHAHQKTSLLRIRGTQ